MSFVSIGLGISFVTVCMLWTLFGYEARRGTRFADKARSHLDFFVLKMTHRLESLLRFFRREYLRNMLHYVFHALLRTVLHVIERWDEKLRTMIRANKSVAKNVIRESTTRSKLEEIALHKVANTMSDEEKKVHKDNILNGQ